MDFGKAFTFMFEDPDWLRKLGIGTLLGVVAVLLFWTVIGVIIPALILLGYSVVVTRNVIARHERPLPEWDDWGSFLALGFKLFVALFIWALPLVVSGIPLAVGASLADSQGAEGIGIFLITCTSCLMVIWGLVVTLFTPAIYVAIASTNEFGSAFNFGGLWAFTRDNLGSVIVAIVLTWLAGLVAAVVGSLGFVVLLIGALITIPLASLWQYLVQAHLFGQIGATSVTSIQ